MNYFIFFISLFTIFFYSVIFLVTLDPRISEESVTIPQPSFWTHETLRVGVCDNGVRVGGSRRGGGEGASEKVWRWLATLLQIMRAM